MNLFDLSEIFSPVSVADFLNGYFGVNTLHVSGNPDRFDSLLIGGAITEASPVVERLDETHPPVMALARRLERALEASVRVNFCCGVIADLEDRDVIILQIAGAGHWKIHGAVKEQTNGAAPIEAPLAWEGALEKGDALYIPRGLRPASAAIPDREPALQLAIYIDNPTGADLLDWFVRHVKQQKCFQTDVPRYAGLAVRVEYLTTLRRTMGQAWKHPGLLELFAQNRRAQAKPRPLHGIPWSAALSGDHVIEMAAPRHIELRRADRETLFFKCDGRPFLFPEDAAPLIQFLCDHAPVSIAQFQASMAGEFDREEISEFLSVLAGGGIIVVHAAAAAD